MGALSRVSLRGPVRLPGLVLVAGLGLLAGCGGGPAPGDPEAKLRRLRGLSLAAARAELAREPDAAARDLLRVGLVVEDPARFGPLCAEVQEASAREWCEQVLDRPHLHEGDPP